LIIWIAGDFSSSISEMAWTPGPRENDQSATAFREAGILMMYPSLRGGNDNPGCVEGFYGEVEDIIAAADYAAALEYVDPGRVYLGGHSTGGTLALLVAECTDKFRAIFSFGPADNPLCYGTDRLPFDAANPKEAELRAPIHWLMGIRTPTFVLEGAKRSNMKALNALAQAPHPPSVSFYAVKGADHFSTLAPLTKLIAAKINADKSAEVVIRFTEEELAAAMQE
jgi:alpha/beta superfamily hydrolase